MKQTILEILSITIKRKCFKVEDDLLLGLILIHNLKETFPKAHDKTQFYRLFLKTSVRKGVSM